jgi:DNA polymerase III alpha subunit (gram-positive type)
VSRIEHTEFVLGWLANRVPDVDVSHAAEDQTVAHQN